MIKEILLLLKSSTFFIEDEDIDIAKGKYEAPQSWADGKNHIMRNNT